MFTSFGILLHIMKWGQMASSHGFMAWLSHFGVDIQDRIVDKTTNANLKRRGVEGNVAVNQLQRKKFYEKLNSEELEIIWVSRDREASHQLEYYDKAMPAWNYIPFGDPTIKALLEKYNVKTIPALKLVNDQGEVLNDQIRTDVERCVNEDPTTCFNKWKSFYQ
uniref:protein-disulfide reductase n=1 Tax=Heterorhabditis bacteriophora TaxID=37862 RepID=A0A1I7X7P1_HETBA